MDLPTPYATLRTHTYWRSPGRISASALPGRSASLLARSVNKSSSAVLLILPRPRPRRQKRPSSRRNTTVMRQISRIVSSHGRYRGGRRTDRTWIRARPHAERLCVAGGSPGDRHRRARPGGRAVGGDGGATRAEHLPIGDQPGPPRHPQHRVPGGTRRRAGARRMGARGRPVRRRHPGPGERSQRAVLPARQRVSDLLATHAPGAGRPADPAIRDRRLQPRLPDGTAAPVPRRGRRRRARLPLAARTRFLRGSDRHRR